MPGGSVRIGRLAGIPIGINPLWLVIVGLITWSLGATYYPDQVSGISPAAAYGLGFASALLLFASIVLHELGHAVVARRRGVAVEGIDLWLLGGVSKLRGSPHGPGDELRYAAAGPAVTLAIALGFGAVVLALPAGTPAALRALLEYQLYVNALILAFNLLPAFPLDGGRILRAVVWARVGEMARATSIAATVGRGFAYGFIFLGVLVALQGAPGGLWLSLIGLFLAFAGRAEEGAQQLRSTLGGHQARELMSYPAVVIPAEFTVDAATGRLRTPPLSLVPGLRRRPGARPVDDRPGGGARAVEARARPWSGTWSRPTRSCSSTRAPMSPSCSSDRRSRSSAGRSWSPTGARSASSRSPRSSAPSGRCD